MCACVRVCVCACVRECMCASACVRERERVRLSVSMWVGKSVDVCVRVYVR